MLLSELLTMSVLGLVLALTVIGFGLGFLRGLQRQTMKAVTAIVAFLFSIVVFSKIFPLLMSSVEGKQVGDILSFVGINLDGIAGTIVNAVEASTAAYILSIPMAVLLMPLGFVGVFLTIQVILIFPYIVICGVLGFTKYANTIVTRVLGAGVGALQGLLMAVVILIPIAGGLGVAEEAVSYVEQTHPTSATTSTISGYYRANVAHLNDNAAIVFVNKYLGSVYESFTHVEVDGEDIDIVTVVDDSLELYVLYGDLNGADYYNLTEENKQTIDQMIEIEGRDEYMVRIISGAMRATAQVYREEKDSFGFEKEISDFFELLLGVFETSTQDNVGGDLKTMKEVYYLLSDSGALSQLKLNGQSAMFNSFLKTNAEGKTTIDQLVATLDSNSRFSGVASGINSLAMALVLKNMEVDGDVQETIEDVKNTLTEVITISKEGKTEEEYKSEVSSKIDETLQNNGIGLNEEQLSKVTDSVITEFEGKEEITDADIAKFMAEYYNAMAGGGSLPGISGGGTPEEVPEEIPEE